MSATPPERTGGRWADEVAAVLAPVVAGRHDEIDRLGRLPDDVVAAMHRSGLFRTWIPDEFGGRDSTVAEGLELIEEVSRLDSATGWVTMIDITTTCLAGSIGHDAAREVFSDPSVVAGGTTAPTGRAVDTDGGLRLSGEWGWGSGIHNATWMACGALRDGDRPRPVLALVPVGELEVLDTWHVSGMQGTGSTHYRATDVFVPEGRVLDLVRAAPWSTRPFHRFAIFWRMGDGAIAGVRVDPDWPGGERSVNEVSEFTRQLLTEYLRLEFGSRPDLLAKVVPDYPPGAKRMVRDNGVWARTLMRPNVELVTGAVARITPTGIVMADGSVHDCDVLIYGTGYEASKFLTPMRVTGRHGVDLHEQWAGDARAYLGVAVPGFPNFFCLYGPNTNLAHGGSIIFQAECQTRYVTCAAPAYLARHGAPQTPEELPQMPLAHLADGGILAASLSWLYPRTTPARGCPSNEIGNLEPPYNLAKEPITMERKTADRKSTRLNSSHVALSRMPSSA